MVMSKILFAIQVYGNNKNTIKMDSIINKIISIITFDKNKEKLNNNKKEYNILNIKEYYKNEWSKLTHHRIHNSFKQPNYFKNLINIKKNMINSPY